MRNLYVLLSLLVIITIVGAGCAPHPSPNAIPVSTPRPTTIPTKRPAIETITGSFRDQISLLEQNMPHSKSEGYVVPTTQEQANFTKLVSMIGTKNLIGAAKLADQDHYTLNYFADNDDHNARSYLLQEQSPIEKGWGMYALRVDSTSNIIIEAPHPLYDRRTPSVALDIYDALDARALLVAGAHRHANSDGSADVAHVPESIFQSVHIELSKEIQAKSGDVVILQIHGFHSTNHPGYPEVVFGLGNDALPKEIALAEKIKDALAEQGIKAGICTGDVLQDLCAKTNAQSAVTKQGSFLHIELAEDIRKDDHAFVAALAQVFAN